MIFKYWKLAVLTQVSLVSLKTSTGSPQSNHSTDGMQGAESSLFVCEFTVMAHP